MTTPEALSVQLRMVADLLETTAKVIGDARFRDAPGLYDGFGDARAIVKAEPSVTAALRSLAVCLERPSTGARKHARRTGERPDEE